MDRTSTPVLKSDTLALCTNISFEYVTLNKVSRLILIKYNFAKYGVKVQSNAILRKLGLLQNKALRIMNFKNYY